MAIQAKHIVVAPVGENLDPLFAGIKEFPTERVILLTPDERLAVAQSAMRDLEKFNIPVQIKSINLLEYYESMFEAVADIKKLEGDKNLLINVSTGDPNLRCAATSAAFVNGIRAFAADEEGTMLLPVLKFSYYKMLTDRKLDILKILQQESFASLDQLSKKTEMSLPLISYHINGNLKSAGLKELGLIETKEEKGKVAVMLSTMGKLLIKGHVQ